MAGIPQQKINSYGQLYKNKNRTILRQTTDHVHSLSEPFEKDHRCIQKA